MSRIGRSSTGRISQSPAEATINGSARQTGPVRLYLPATLDELDGPAPAGAAAAPSATTDLAPRRGHAVTAALRAALTDEDEESIEFAAQLAAADDALLLLAGRPAAPQLRLVVTVEVPDALVAPVVDPTAAVSAVDLTAPAARDRIVCVHVDEPEARADIDRALAGEANAMEALAERDLLWYDATEIAHIPR